ncbi:DNA translocase FtsK [Candidatus Microgenomates bacterium]|nr:DNA translocase FtsK [Candidatus Microgenomates bacterium]
MSKKKRRSSQPRKSFRLKLKKNTTYSIAQVFFFSLAGLVIVSFWRRGIILTTFNDYLVSWFSWTTIFLPFLLLSFGFSVSKLKSPLSQPNVVVGSLLFYLSFATLVKAGQFGVMSWEGIAGLITTPGAFIVLFGLTFVGLVIMFNTSVDQVLQIVATWLKYLRRYLIGEKELTKLNPAITGKKEFKVAGGMSNPQINTPAPIAKSMAKPEELSAKLVTNVPGEEKIWKYPALDLIEQTEAGKADRGDIKSNAAVIEQTLESFGVTARVVEVNLGPAVTQYALEVALGTKLSKITGLDRDLALALAAPTGAIRIEAPIPGRSLVGIELPNRAPEFVPIRKILESDAMRESPSKLSVALGLDVAGKPIVGDLGKMPHVLIAGQTGSGKSVAINTFLCSLLFRASPSEVKLILVDPKRVELTGYNNIPHLLAPVIVEPDKVISALRWVMAEMDRRYKLFAQVGARNISSYNEMSGFQAMPYIVVVIDELADIMLLSPVEVEDAITRIAQMSRATGIHMVLATQRPSVNVITGLIKANIPTRIAFAVASLIDSRVILDTQGAEKLLGKGDMLYLPPEAAKPTRIQGAFISDKDVNNLIGFIKNQGVNPQYTEEVTNMAKAGSNPVAGVVGDADDMFSDAVRTVTQSGKASASLLQRRLSVGYARAARLIDQLEAAGIVGPADGAKPREVNMQNAEQYLQSGTSA